MQQSPPPQPQRVDRSPRCSAIAPTPRPQNPPFPSTARLVFYSFRLFQCSIVPNRGRRASVCAATSQLHPAAFTRPCSLGVRAGAIMFRPNGACRIIEQWSMLSWKSVGCRSLSFACATTTPTSFSRSDCRHHRGPGALPLPCLCIASGLTPQPALLRHRHRLSHLRTGVPKPKSGPTGPSSWSSRIVALHGIDGLFMCTVMPAFLLMIMGIAGMGTAVKFIPRRVMASPRHRHPDRQHSGEEIFRPAARQSPGVFWQRVQALAGNFHTISYTGPHWLRPPYSS